MVWVFHYHLLLKYIYYYYSWWPKIVTIIFYWYLFHVQMDLYLELLTICWLFGFFLACSPSSWSNSSQHRTDLAWKRCVFKCTWIDQWLILQQVKIQLKFNHLWCLVWLMPDKILWHVKIDVILLSKIKIDWWCCNVSAYLIFFLFIENDV